MKNTIFIPIAACEEKFIEQTVKSALFNAYNPKNIYFGIFNNILDKKHSLLDNDFIVNNSQIFYTELVSGCPMGTGFGRMNASLLQFKNFEYMFQIDAHTIFSKNWDVLIIEYFNKIKDQENLDADKMVLSCVPPIVWKEVDGNIYARGANSEEFIQIDPYRMDDYLGESLEMGTVVPKFYYDGFQGTTQISENLGFPIAYGNGHIKNDYQEIDAIHASFVFSKSNINREVLLDPQDPFHGDQSNYAVRLISRNYRIFCPKFPVIGTLNKFENNPLDIKKNYNWRSWRKNNKNGLSRDASSLYFSFKNDKSNVFFSDMISGRYFGYWGSPSIEALKKAKMKIDYPIQD